MDEPSSLNFYHEYWQANIRQIEAAAKEERIKNPKMTDIELGELLGKRLCLDAFFNDKRNNGHIWELHMFTVLQGMYPVKVEVSNV